MSQRGKGKSTLLLMLSPKRDILQTIREAWGPRCLSYDTRFHPPSLGLADFCPGEANLLVSGAHVHAMSLAVPMSWGGLGRQQGRTSRVWLDRELHKGVSRQLLMAKSWEIPQFHFQDNCSQYHCPINIFLYPSFLYYSTNYLNSPGRCPVTSGLTWGSVCEEHRARWHW